MTSALDADDALQFTLAPGGNKFVALTTNLLLPADAAEYLVLLPNGTAISPPINASTGQLVLGELRLPVNATVCLRMGGGALAAKVFELDGVAGQPPTLSLIADAAGQNLNAARLTGQHFRSTGGTPAWINGSANGRHARFAALAVAGSAADSAGLINLCESTHAAPTRSTVTGGGLWTAEAEAGVRAGAGAGTGSTNPGLQTTAVSPFCMCACM